MISESIGHSSDMVTENSPGEKYFRGYKMNEREADALLRKDLNKFIALFAGFKPMDALLLGVLSYNIGPVAVMKSSVYRKLKAGNRNIFKSYTAHCKYKGRFHKGLYKRRCQKPPYSFRKINFL